MKKTDEELAQEALKGQADMLSKAFGLEKSKEYEIPDDAEILGLLWTDSVARIRDLPMAPPENSICYVEEEDRAYIFCLDQGWMGVSDSDPQETLDLTADSEWWRDQIESGLEVTSYHTEYPEGGPVVEEPSRVLDSDT